MRPFFIPIATSLSPLACFLYLIARLSNFSNKVLDLGTLALYYYPLVNSGDILGNNSCAAMVIHFVGLAC